jgi:hypothetical protein
MASELSNNYTSILQDLKEKIRQFCNALLQNCLGDTIALYLTS